ncbi:MAG: hypothetical protein U1E76_27320, partial [Planctomycetota bacterium]
MAYLPIEPLATQAARLMGLGAIVMLPAVLGSGTMLPLVFEMAAAQRAESSGHIVGRLLGWNTLGAIAGLLLATYVLLASLGLFLSLACAGTMMLVLGEVCLRDVRARAPRRILFAGACIAMWLWLPDLPRVWLDRGQELVALTEGSQGIVAVVADAGSLRIKLNNHYTVGGTGSTGDTRQLGHLPLLLHPEPRQVAFLGLGTGITAGAATLHPTQEIVVVELVPEVVAAARTHFAGANLGLLDDSRTTVIADDAGSYLHGSRRTFDVIVGDLVVPWRAGESTMYCLEQFAAARQALAPGGLFCQWLPLYQLSRQDLDTILATFLDVFPRTTLWRGDFVAELATLALVGHTDQHPVDIAALDRRVSELAPRLGGFNPYLRDPAGFWLFALGAPDPRDPRLRNARRNSEAQPWVELSWSAGHQAFLGAPLEEFLRELRRGDL